MSAARSRVKTDVNMSMYTYIRRYIRIRYKSIHMCVCVFFPPRFGSENRITVIIITIIFRGDEAKRKKNTPRNYVRVSYRRSYRAQISTQ